MDIKKSLKDVIVLVVICAVFGTALAAVNSFVAPIIEARLAGAADKAYAEVMPGATGFEDVDFTGLTLPATVKEAKREKSGMGYAIKLETTGYGSGMVLIIGVDAEGKVTGAKCISSNETNGVEKTYGDNMLGKDIEGVKAVDIVAASTLTSKAYRDAVVDAINAATIFGGGSADVRTEEQILADNLAAALPAGEGAFTKMFMVEVVEGVEKVYTADNGAGYVLVVDGMFVGVGADGVATDVIDNTTTPVTEGIDTLKATAEAGVVIVSATGELVDVDITALEGISKKITSIKKTASGNYVFEIKADGYGINGDHYIRSNKHIEMIVSISADGKIIDAQTISEEETPNYGGIQLKDGALNSLFIGKDETGADSLDFNVIKNGSTITSNGYKMAIMNCFAAYTIIVGGAN